MNNFLFNIKFHWVAILISVFFGLFVSSPGLLSIHSISDFKGVYQTFNDEETYYQARVSEVVRGNWMVSNVYIKEHKDNLFLVPPVAEWIIGLIAMFFGLSVPFTMFVNDIFFTVISFLLFYLLLFKILRSRLYSLFYSSIFYILFIHILGRPVNPQLTNIFLFLGLLLIYKIYYKEGNINVLNFFFGVVFGLALFISPYYGSALGLFYFILCITKPFIEEGLYKVFKSIKYFLITSLPFVLMYALLMNKVSKLSDYTDSSIRFGLINTHYLGSHSNILIAIFCLVLFFVNIKNLATKERWLLLGCISSIFILNWQNLITGQLIQFASHYYLITVVLSFLVVVVVHRLLMNSDHSKRKIIASTLVIFLLFSFVFYKQYREVLSLWDNVSSEEEFYELQEKSEVFEWLNTNTKKDSVVYTLGENYDDLIPIYTNNRVYYNFYATLSIMPNSETENRWLNQQLFNPEMNQDFILDNQRDFWCNTYIDKYHFEENRRKIVSKLMSSNYIASKQFDEKLIEDLYGRYKAKLNSDPISIIKEYEVDYILLSLEYDYYSYVLEYLKNSKLVDQVININNVIIYKVNK